MLLAQVNIPLNPGFLNEHKLTGKMSAFDLSFQGNCSL